VRAGAGTEDVVNLDGDYSEKLVFGSNKLRGVEMLTLGAGHSYNLVTHDNTVAAGKQLEVRGYWLGTDDNLIFDGSAEKNGKFEISGGSGNDPVIAGENDDELVLHGGGVDVVSAGAGDDVFDMRDTLTGTDRIDGGIGYDILDLAGQVNVVLGSSTVKNVEEIRLGNAYDYKFSVTDDLLGKGGYLRIKGWSLQAQDRLTLNGAAERDGAFDVESGDGADVLIGGARRDFFRSAEGPDTLNGNGGNDTLEGGAGSDSLKGGAGKDLASYQLSSSGVRVSLAAGVGKAGDAEGDTLFSIENLIGSNHADVLRGNVSANTLNGSHGDDILIGRGGGDTLTGGAGSDHFVFNGASWDVNRIKDFENDYDKIDLAKNGFSFEDLKIVYDNGDAKIECDRGIIQLDDVASGLTASDFVF